MKIQEVEERKEVLVVLPEIMKSGSITRWCGGEEPQSREVTKWSVELANEDSLPTGGPLWRFG